MAQYLRAGFVCSETLAFDDLGDGFIELAGVITCVAGIYVDVYKRLVILEGDGPHALVQTVAYSYNAVLGGVGNIFRYDSPHPDHNQEHHRHGFDVFAKHEIKPPRFIVDEHERPTLGEVIAEVERWYYDHLDAVHARVVGDGPAR